MYKLLFASLLVGFLGLVATVSPAGAEPPVAPAVPVVAPPACPACIQKVCRPEPEIKKTTKVVYGCKEVDYCLPRCSAGSLFAKKGCDGEDASCTQCEHPRTRRVLIKKFVPEEKCATRCVVEQVVLPVCPDACPVPCAPHVEKFAAPK